MVCSTYEGRGNPATWGGRLRRACGRAPRLARLVPSGYGAAATGGSQLSIAAAGEPRGRHIEATPQHEPRIPQHQVPEEPFPRRGVSDDPRHVENIRDEVETTIQAEADAANPGGSQQQPMEPAVLPGAHEGERQQTTADLEDAGSRVDDEPRRPARRGLLFEWLEAGLAPGGPGEAQGREEEGLRTGRSGHPSCPVAGRRARSSTHTRSLRHVTPRSPTTLLSCLWVQQLGQVGVFDQRLPETTIGPGHQNRLASNVHTERGFRQFVLQIGCQPERPTTDGLPSTGSSPPARPASRFRNSTQLSQPKILLSQRINMGRLSSRSGGLAQRCSIDP
jgi:hypothetical protein